MTGREHLRVTYLELREAPAAAEPWTGPEHINLEVMSAADYLDLYRRVGGPLRWDTRRDMPLDELESLLAGGSLHIYLVRGAPMLGAPLAGAEGRADAASIPSSGAKPPVLGFCEFDRTAFPEIEIKHFGLVPEAQGLGLGPWLLSTALCSEWESGATRIWLHTDTWDHPAAVPVYQRAGLRVFDVRYQSAEGL